MKLLNDRIGVNFDFTHNKVVGKGLNGIDIVRPDQWINVEALQQDGVTSRFDENVNYLETNPQICVVVHPSVNHGYLPGDKLFVNYMAYEWAEKTEYGDVIDADFIMFKIADDDSVELIDYLYLGEAIFDVPEKTSGGIYIPDIARQKDNLKVRITHVPKNSTVNIGDIVVAIDKNNYEFSFNDKKYIKLMEHEMVAVVVQNKEILCRHTER